LRRSSAARRARSLLRRKASSTTTFRASSIRRWQLRFRLYEKSSSLMTKQRISTLRLKQKFRISSRKKKKSKKKRKRQRIVKRATLRQKMQRINLINVCKP